MGPGRGRRAGEGREIPWRTSAGRSKWCGGHQVRESSARLKHRQSNSRQTGSSFRAQMSFVEISNIFMETGLRTKINEEDIINEDKHGYH